MARPTRWRELVPGLLATAALGVIVVAVLLFARVGALRGDTLRVVVLAPSARELLAGSEVWIAGQKVGVVETIEFRSAATDTNERLAITVAVLEAARPQLRADTHAEFKTGGSLLGAPVVALVGGSSAAPPLEDGDTIRARREVDPQSVAAGFARAGADLPVLRENVVAILAELREADGTLGAAMRGETFASAGALAGRLRRLGASLGSDRGTVGALVSERGTVRARIVRVQARADSVRQVLDSPTGTFGRFRRDSALVRQITEVRDEIAIVRALIDLPAGTAGRVVHDGILAEQLADLQVQLDALIADMKARPFRYVVF